MNYWIIKSEPSSYSIDDLKKDKRTAWTGVRNYQARNFIKDMETGDEALFYHSGGLPSVVGIARVKSAPYPDITQFDKRDSHFDSKATKEKPTWYCVDFEFAEKFFRPVPLLEIKQDPKLKGISVARKGIRLSVLPVSKAHFERIIQLGQK